MADKQPPPVGTAAMSENPALDNLREREKMLTEKLANLDKADPNVYTRQSFDLNQVKDRAKRDLVEIRKAIKEITK